MVFPIPTYCVCFQRNIPFELELIRDLQYHLRLKIKLKFNIKDIPLTNTQKPYVLTFSSSGLNLLHDTMAHDLAIIKGTILDYLFYW
jgi:hypothetical protein